MSELDATDDKSPDERSICRAASCWRTGTPVKVDGDTDRPAVLCRIHQKVYLGVSS